jgi:monoamine oxidase
MGYLKEHHYSLFTPQLPQNKIRAIENLGFGAVNKIFVVFDRPVLSKDNEGLQVLWRDDMDFRLTSVVNKWNLANQTFYRLLDNFEVLPNMPNVLLCFTTGNDAVYIERLSDECLMDVLCELFAICFAKLKLPKPKQLVRSRWASEPFARGSYTYVKTGSSINDCRSLSQPLGNQLYFAGEGTNHLYISTVHGAYITGREAANKIIKSLNMH